MSPLPEPAGEYEPEGTTEKSAAGAGKNDEKSDPLPVSIEVAMSWPKPASIRSSLSPPKLRGLPTTLRIAVTYAVGYFERTHARYSCFAFIGAGLFVSVACLDARAQRRAPRRPASRLLQAGSTLPPGWGARASSRGAHRQGREPGTGKPAPRPSTRSPPWG